MVTLNQSQHEVYLSNDKATISIFSADPLPLGKEPYLFAVGYFAERLCYLKAYNCIVRHTNNPVSEKIGLYITSLKFEAVQVIPRQTCLL